MNCAHASTQPHLVSRPAIGAGTFFDGVESDELWENLVDSNKFVTKVKRTALKPLFDYARTNTTADHYLSSPTYFLMTGRKGLWIYERGDSKVAFGWHPNVDGKIIFFPPSGPQGLDLIADILNLDVKPSGGFEIVRVPEEQAPQIAAALAKRVPSLGFNPTVEHMLDWTFPVHTMSVERLANPEGGEMRDFRKNLNRAHQHGLVIERLDPIAHKKEIEILTYLWAKSRHNFPIRNRELLAEPSRFVFDLMRLPKVKIDGIMVFTKDGEPVGFNIWEMPMNGSQIVNGVTNVANTTEYKGISELLFHEQAKILRAQGVQGICLGGSESASLNEFKLKMKPIQSASLRTIHVLPACCM
ncbi:MAG: DUF2156 domain-containing protein [Proteobacteria bacterium]|nr:DUF2156 domain-containing protein [Pseudomonadota bacterium]